MQDWSGASSCTRDTKERKSFRSVFTLRTFKVYRSSATRGTSNTLAVKWMRLAAPVLLTLVAVAVVVGVAERTPVEVPTCEGFVERKKNVPPRGVAKPTLLANDWRLNPKRLVFGFTRVWLANPAVDSYRSHA